MKIPTSLLLIAGALVPAIVTAGPALTIYNQNFAVVRDTVPLDLSPASTPCVTPAPRRKSSRTR